MAHLHELKADCENGRKAQHPALNERHLCGCVVFRAGQWEVIRGDLPRCDLSECLCADEILDDQWELVAEKPSTPSPPEGFDGCEMWRVRRDRADRWIADKHLHAFGTSVQLHTLPSYGLVGFTDERAKEVVCNVPGPYLWRDRLDGFLSGENSGSANRVPAAWAVMKGSAGHE